MTITNNSNMDALYFGKASEQDFLGIADLDRRAWGDNHAAEFIPDGEHVWRVWVDAAIVTVCKNQHEIVGVALAFPTCQGGFCVHKVFVDKPYRAKGIGTKLFELLLLEIDSQRGASCYLTVDPKNNAALKLYENLGFSEKQFVAGYYRSHEDRYVMTRPAKK